MKQAVTKTEGLEIERKYRIEGFPDNQGWPLLEEALVQQGYLCTRPVVRIRSKQTSAGTDYVLCFKGKGTLVRQEVELPLEEAVFHQLEQLLEAPLIQKEYRVYALPDGHRLECSLVDRGSDDSFYYAEVEFSSIAESQSFQPPEILGEEWTENPYYGMSAYWERKVSACKSSAKR